MVNESKSDKSMNLLKEEKSKFINIDVRGKAQPL